MKKITNSRQHSFETLFIRLRRRDKNYFSSAYARFPYREHAVLIFQRVLFQALVNYYASELGIAKHNKERQNKKDRRHLFEIEAYGKYDYHHKHYDKGSDRFQKFYDPELVADYTRRM